MVITSGNCIVPFALWNSHCPQHSISCVLTTKDKKHLITGSCDGRIIKWKLGKDFQCTPVYMLLGHETRVTNLCLAYEDDDRVYFVSSTETGEMCLWALEDGRCVIHRTNSRFIHTSIQSHAAAYNKRAADHHSDGGVPLPRGAMRLLFCCGRYPMLVVLEATSLQPLFHLSSRSHPTRFTALTVFSHPNQPTDVVLGLSANQAVTVWTVGASDSWPAYVTNADGSQSLAAPSQKSENESKTIQCPGGQVVAMRCCPKNPRTVLIVSQRTWQVHDAVDWCLLCSLSVEEENRREGSNDKWEWTGGEFISLDTVLVLNSEGRARLYRLPVCAIAGQENFRQMKERRSPVFVASFERSANAAHPQDGLVDSSAYFSLDDSDPYVAQQQHQQLQPHGAPRFAFHFEAPLLVRGDAEGHVTFWNSLPEVLKRLERLGPDLPSSCNVERIPSTRVTSLEEQWEKAKPRGLVDCLLPRDSSGAHSSVTAAAFAQLPAKIIMGLASGDILVASILDCMAHVYFANRQLAPSALGPPCHMRLSSGHTRAVSALCYPGNRARGAAVLTNDYPPEILVSGGADFTVRLWDLNTGAQVANFSPHGAPIMAIVTTPEQCSKRVQGSVCCIAADHSVSLVGLRDRKVHLVANLQPNPLSVIKWRPQEDFLLIGCTDGSVFVWETTSGHLDRHLQPGPTANSALSAAEHPFRIPIRLYKRHGFTMDFDSSGLDDKVVSSHGGGGGGRLRVADRARLSTADLRPLKLQNVQGGVLPGRDWHVLYLDTEALVLKLLMEEAARKSANSAKDPHGGRSSASSSSMKQQLMSRVKAVFPNPASGGSITLAGLRNSPEPARRHPMHGAADNSATANGASDENETGALELALLLVSLLHAWDLDPGLDRSCTVTLGLLRPRRAVYYGSVSHGNGFVCLYLPQVPQPAPEPPQVPYWLSSSHLTTQYLLAIVAVSDTLMQLIDGSQLRAWPIFSERLCIPGEPDRENSSSSTGISRSLASFGTIKQSWSLLTAHHCVLLPELADRLRFKGPKLVALARKWQDRCLPVRVAAQTLLLSQLNQIGPDGRQQLLLRWAPFLPFPNEASPPPASVERLRLSSIGSIDETLLSLQLAMQSTQPLRDPPEPPSKRPPERPPLPAAHGGARPPKPPPPSITNISNSASVSNGVPPTARTVGEGHQLQALAVVLLGVIGAEYGSADKAHALEGFGRDDYHLSRQICRALIALVLPQPSTQSAAGSGPGAGGGTAAPDSARHLHHSATSPHALGLRLLGALSHASSPQIAVHVEEERSRSSHHPSSSSQHSSSAAGLGSALSLQQHTAMRLAAMEILGRGFAVWEPYIDVSALLVALLEYSLASSNSHDEIDNLIISGIPLSPSADKARTARQAVDLIALARPRLFILTLSREIKRYNSMAANSQLAGSAAPTSLPIYAARWLILRSLENLCEKRMVEVMEVLSEAMEVLLHCIDLNSLKETRSPQTSEPLRDFFPPIGRFPNVTSSLKSQKIAIGTKTGSIVLYDFKQGKFNTVPNAHPGAISSTSFHPNGKHVATFSLQDRTLRVWQLGSATIFGMVGTQLKCVTTRPLHSLPDLSHLPDLRGDIFVEWLDNRSLAVYGSSGMLEKMRVL